ncbi:hypothetical protein SALBM311S_03069 [Streptomyces alboniger]
MILPSTSTTSGPSMSMLMPSPAVSSVEDSTTGMSMSLSCFNCLANTLRGNPEAMTASGLSRTACVQAAWTDCGVPWVGILLTLSRAPWRPR